jgi:hypothetical protein
MADIKYDPNKKYVWTPETEFTLKGGEFGAVLNTMRAILSSPEAQRVLMANQTNDIVESVLSKAVENGLVQEAPENENS